MRDKLEKPLGLVESGSKAAFWLYPFVFRAIFIQEELELPSLY